MTDDRNVIVQYPSNLPPSMPYNPVGRVAGETYAVRDVEEALRLHPDAVILGFEGESPLLPIPVKTADYLERRLERLEEDGSVDLARLAPDIRAVVEQLDPNMVTMLDDRLEALEAPGSVTRPRLAADVTAGLPGRVSTQALVGIGDSMVESPSFDWLAIVASYLASIPVQNLGKSGWASTDIAVRFGALDPLLTVTGNTIPELGAVTVTALAPATSYRTNGSGAITWSGTLANVAGTLAHNMDTATWTFTRATPGVATPCPAGTAFHSTTGDTYRDRIAIIWVGRNNIGDPPNKLLDVVRDIDLIVAALTSANRRYIVLGVTPSSTENATTARWVEIATVNAYLAARHGARFIDIAAHLRDKGLAQVGLAPTPTDTTDIANGLIPTALKADSIHLNDLGKTVVARAVARAIANLGWVPGAIPPPELASPTMITSDSFNRADSAVNGMGTSDAAYGGTGTTWTGTGEVRILGNALGRQTATGIRFAYLSAGAADHRISAKVLALPTGANLAGLIARRADSSNYYGAYVDANGAVQLVKVVAGSSSGLMGPSNTGTLTPGDTLELRVVGTSISVLVNGVTILTRTDAALTAGNDCGVRFPSTDTQIAFDDVRVWSA